MEYTPHYQLNQWVPEDRLLRTDFNTDNARIDTALHQGAEALAQARSSLEGALAQERQDRAGADNTLRQELNSAVAAAKGEAANAISAEQSVRASQDTAIRQEFAAADASVAAANPLVKLMEITTSANAPQVDLDLSSIPFGTYLSLFIVIRLSGSCPLIYVRGNNLSTPVYASGSYSKNEFGQIYPYNSGAYTICHLSLHGSLIACRLMVDTFFNRKGIGTTDCSVIPPSTLSPRDFRTLNFISSDGSNLYSGSKFTIYGLR